MPCNTPPLLGRWGWADDARAVAPMNMQSIETTDVSMHAMWRTPWRVPLPWQQATRQRDSMNTCCCVTPLHGETEHSLLEGLEWGWQNDDDGVASEVGAPVQRIRCSWFSE